MSKIPGLENALKGEFTSDLTSTTIEFISRGTSTIIDSDFATLAPLQIVSTGHFFNLETIGEQISSNNPNFNPKVSVIDNKKFSITFEYLKPKQAFSVSVLHDGRISVSGDLKSGKIRLQQNSSGFEERNRQSRNPSFIAFMFPVFATMFVMIFSVVFFPYLIRHSDFVIPPVLSYSSKGEDDAPISKFSISDAEYIEMKSNLESILEELELQNTRGSLSPEEQTRYYYLAAEYCRMIEYLTRISIGSAE